MDGVWRMDEEPKNEEEPEVLILRFQLLIPENEYGIPAKYYIGNEIVKLLRDYKNNPDVIQFIADMLEE